MKIESQTNLPTSLAGNDASSTEHSAFERLAAVEEDTTLVRPQLELEQDQDQKPRRKNADSWLDRAWGSVRDTAESVDEKIKDALLPFVTGKWDARIGAAVRSIAAGGVPVTASPTKLDKQIGTVVRKGAFRAADAMSGNITNPQNLRA
ncbi:hypothetical protein [Bordetella sp. LUAb4]|uniref:hypothetical protein n=1 Tax=Bordetella sp. LUAb4 TaxID=2843195 RepID=UPI001E34CCE5|nr:hypothetical protein [Bordetella sp. LUAb4]